MAFAYSLLATAFVFISIAVQSLATLSRRELRTAPGSQDEYPLIPPLGSQHYGSQGSNDLEILNIVLLASVDGNLHALNRSTGTVLWSMSSNSPDSPSALGPLVRTKQAVTLDDEGDDFQQEYYVIEPQSGDIYIMSSKSEPLQRLPFSMSTLVDMTPFRLSGEEDSKTFIGRKETSLLLIELETGRIKQTISSECPWNEYEDPFEDLREAEEELDSDDQDGARPPKPRKPTDVFVGRTGEPATPCYYLNSDMQQITTSPFVPASFRVLHLAHLSNIYRSLLTAQTTRTTGIRCSTARPQTTCISSPPLMGWSCPSKSHRMSTILQRGSGECLFRSRCRSRPSVIDPSA